jgi:flagellar hook-associated protein 1 FlgK
VIPTNTGIETALRGLTAAQAAIDTTGENISNANNPNYSRQVAVEVESPGLNLTGFSNNTGDAVQLGQGVDVSTINRVRDQFLDVQYRAQNTNTSGLNTASGLLQQVQTALAEPSTDGVSSQLTAFWSSWSDLANDPSGSGSLAAKQAVVDDGTTLAETFNGIESQLQTIQNQASSQFTALTASNGQVQSDANQIASLNGEINQALGAGQSPNDLLDQRDQLLDDLSQYGSVSVTDPGNGLLVVNFGGDTTTPLVNGKTANAVSSLNLTPASGGTLGTLLNLSSSSGPISSYLTSMNTFANTLASSVNAIHSNPPFFTVSSSPTSLGSTSTTLGVGVTASQVQTTTTTNPGANDIPLAISQLAGGAADQQYSAFVAQVGSDVQSNQASLTTANTLLSSIQNQRQSVSGVSLDEEMTNLVTYQQAYQASARMMTTIDSTLDTLINHTGTVGL